MINQKAISIINIKTLVDPPRKLNEANGKGIPVGFFDTLMTSSMKAAI